MTNEEYESLMKEAVKDGTAPGVPESVTFKCKPCWNFQSVEFEYTIPNNRPNRADFETMFEIYRAVLAKLMIIAPEQEKKVQPVPTNLATDKQKEIMRKFGIEFTNKTTRKEAQDMIQASIDSTR